MQTTASLRKITAASLALLVCGAVAANAQLTFKADLAASAGAEGVTLSGSDVVEWSSVGNTVSLTPAGATSPTFTPGALNGQGYVSFSGDALEATGITSGSFLGGTASATFLVLATSPQSGTAISWINPTRAAASDFSNLYQVSEHPAGGNVNYVHGPFNQSVPVDGVTSAPAPDWSLSSPLQQSDFHVLTLIRNGSSGEIRLDGLSLGTESVTGAITSESGTLMVGGLAGIEETTWAGHIAEIRVYSTVPTDINNIELELGGTYGLSVVPEPSEYAMIFGLACVAGALALRYRRQVAS